MDNRPYHESYTEKMSCLNEKNQELIRRLRGKQTNVVNEPRQYVLSEPRCVEGMNELSQGIWGREGNIRREEELSMPQEEFSMPQEEFSMPQEEFSMSQEEQKGCYPFDPYGFNSYLQTVLPVNVVTDGLDDLVIDFNAVVKIPVGFYITPCNGYQRRISMDGSELQTNFMTQYYLYTNSNKLSSCENCQTYSGNKGEVVRMQVAVLKGVVTYNVTLGNLVPYVPLQSSNLVTTSLVDSTGILAIDKIIGYGYAGYTLPAQYTACVIEKPEYIITPCGGTIYRQSDPQAFFAALCNVNVPRYINCPYQLIIKCNQTDQA